MFNSEAKYNVSMAIQYPFVNPNEKPYMTIYTNCESSAETIVQS